MGPSVATASSQLNLWGDAGCELSRCSLDQLFDPSALEIGFVPGSALQHDYRAPPATDQIHILFCDAAIGGVVLFGKVFVGNHQR